MRWRVLALIVLGSGGCGGSVAAEAVTEAGGVSDGSPGPTDARADAADGVEDTAIPAPRSCPAGTAALAGGTFALFESKAVVTVRGFCLDRLLVTAVDYGACVDAGACRTTKGRSCASTEEILGLLERPINCVAQQEASAYCAWRGKRLPTESEMEWAARGGPAGTLFPWGNAPPRAEDVPQRLCWSGLARTFAPCIPGAFPTGNSPLDLADLTSNVRQWTSTPYEKDDRVFVTRGSSYNLTDPDFVRAGYRQFLAGESTRDTIGFRCAADGSASP